MSVVVTVQTPAWHEETAFLEQVQIMVFSFAICVPMNIHSCSFASVKSMLDEDDASVQIFHRKMKLKIRNCKRCRPRLSVGVKAYYSINYSFHEGRNAIEKGRMGRKIKKTQKITESQNIY